MSCLPSGYGSQALALKYLGIPFEHWKICEWAIKSIQAYKDIHFPNDYHPAGVLDIPKEEIIDFLYSEGISSNYNEPMTLDQIKRLPELSLYNIYENNYVTNNLVNIQKVKAEDLEIVDTDKYEYIMTYSFPCQDLSLAGKGKGMSDTSTRSGMLWEVERILTECKELGTMPQVLLMENVPQVHNQDNMPDFHKWQVRLEELGYKSYWQDLIATDYGIPQTRNRCFMVSILGNYSYTFPNPIPLKLKLKDMLEDNVNEKYYLSDKCIKTMLKHDTDYKPIGLAPTLTTELSHHTGKNFTPKIIREIEYANNEILKRKMCNDLIKQGKVEEGDVVKHSYTQQILDGNKKCVEKNDGNMITLTTRGDCVEVCVKGIATNESKEWQKEPLEEKSRTILANKSNGGVGLIDTNLRIRKLTPRECFRLMGVKDEDFDKVRNNQSDASLYHLAGDSIVVNVLMAIFKELLESKGK